MQNILNSLPLPLKRDNYPLQEKLTYIYLYVMWVGYSPVDGKCIWKSWSTVRCNRDTEKCIKHLCTERKNDHKAACATYWNLPLLQKPPHTPSNQSALHSSAGCHCSDLDDHNSLSVLKIVSLPSGILPQYPLTKYFSFSCFLSLWKCNYRCVFSQAWLLWFNIMFEKVPMSLGMKSFILQLSRIQCISSPICPCFHCRGRLGLAPLWSYHKHFCYKSSCPCLWGDSSWIMRYLDLQLQQLRWKCFQRGTHCPAHHLCTKFPSFYVCAKVYWKSFQNLNCNL